MAEVELSKRGAVATLLLNRPERKNATTLELWDWFERRVGEVEADAEIRALIVTGAGQAFCAGADTGGSFPKTRAESLARVVKAQRIVARLHGLNRPVIAAVRGPAVGSGFAIALSADFIFTSETARFSYAFTRLGLVADAGALFFLKQRLGEQRAKELAYTSRMVDAAEALQLGISFRNLPDAELDAAVNAFGAELAEAPTFAIGVTKRLLQKNWTSLEDFLPEELLTVPLMSTTDDAAEGIAAMREKRKPRFKGS
jgi:2-(1,2-epoxy-1,2-dihydrophenyl)acetyl-CoA isomerase